MNIDKEVYNTLGRLLYVCEENNNPVLTFVVSKDLKTFFLDINLSEDALKKGGIKKLLSMLFIGLSNKFKADPFELIEDLKYSISDLLNEEDETL